MDKKFNYTVIRSFRHRGRNLIVGELVTLHPRQAQYLIGTHLELTTVASEDKKNVKKTKGERK